MHMKYFSKFEFDEIILFQLSWVLSYNDDQSHYRRNLS